jgi:hypothetical protein
MSNQPHDKDDLRLPARLERELRTLCATPRVIPPSVDDAVLRGARRYLRQSAGLNRLIQFPRWLAAAAAIILGALVASLFFSPGRQNAHAREDINADGRVDILDAFALARQLEARGIPELRLDFNGDGVVDRKDVEAIAGRAVKLEKGRG